MIYVIFILILSIVLAVTMKSKPKRKTTQSNPCLFSPEKKGEHGENLIKKLLVKLPGENMICSNVYLPKENGGTSETDIIFIHETGIYVIESKFYSGKIYVNENFKEWTQYLGRNQCNKFYNPIMQNKTHIKYLKKLLKSNDINVEDKNIFSLVIFGETSDLDKEIFTENLMVTTGDLFFFNLRDRFKSCSRIFSKKDIKKIYNVLKSYCNVADKVKKRHIANVNKSKF